MVFTASGAQEFNDLTGGDPAFHFQEEDDFGTAKFFIPEPSAAALYSAAVAALCLLRQCSRRRRNSSE